MNQRLLAKERLTSSRLKITIAQMPTGRPAIQTQPLMFTINKIAAIRQIAHALIFIIMIPPKIINKLTRTNIICKTIADVPYCASIKFCSTGGMSGSSGGGSPIAIKKPSIEIINPSDPRTTMTIPGAVILAFEGLDLGPPWFGCWKLGVE